MLVYQRVTAKRSKSSLGLLSFSETYPVRSHTFALDVRTSLCVAAATSHQVHDTVDKINKFHDFET
jgi:hypothetical protein